MTGAEFEFCRYLFQGNLFLVMVVQVLGNIIYQLFMPGTFQRFCELYLVAAEITEDLLQPGFDLFPVLLSVFLAQFNDLLNSADQCVGDAYALLVDDAEFTEGVVH